jgi:hypothetical protein
LELRVNAIIGKNINSQEVFLGFTNGGDGYLIVRGRSKKKRPAGLQAAFSRKSFD